MLEIHIHEIQFAPSVNLCETREIYIEIGIDNGLGYYKIMRHVRSVSPLLCCYYSCFVFSTLLHNIFCLDKTGKSLTCSLVVRPPSIPG